MGLGVSYAWDEAKRKSNLAKHGVDFTAVTGLDWNKAMTKDQSQGGELRHVTYAPLMERIYVLVWTQRGEDIRIISLRKANNREIAEYETV